MYLLVQVRSLVDRGNVFNNAKSPLSLVLHGVTFYRLHSTPSHDHVTELDLYRMVNGPIKCLKKVWQADTYSCLILELHKGIFYFNPVFPKGICDNCYNNGLPDPVAIPD